MTKMCRGGEIKRRAGKEIYLRTFCLQAEATAGVKIELLSIKFPLIFSQEYLTFSRMKATVQKLVSRMHFRKIGTLKACSDWHTPLCKILSIKMLTFWLQPQK